MTTRIALRMFAGLRRLFTLFTLIGAGLTFAEANEGYQVPPVIGGPGGVYLQAKKGVLEVEVSKRDLNLSDRYQNTLYAFLLTPDRKVVAKAVLHDDNDQASGSVGKVSRERLRAEVDTPGIYLLLVELTGFDGQRHDLAWGFSTNAERYQMIRGEYATGRGRTPLLLEGMEAPMKLYFLPTKAKFDIKALTRRGQAGEVVVTPPGGTPVNLELRGEQEETTTFRADLSGLQPWEVAVRAPSLTLDVEAVTYWKRWGGFAFESHGFFSFHREAFFPMQDLRWALTPYYSVVKVPKEGSGQISWKVKNHSPERPYRLRIEAVSPEGSHVELSPSKWEQTVRPGQETVVMLSYKSSGAELPLEGESHQLRISSPDLPEYETYSSVAFVPKSKRAPLNLPVRFEPFSHFKEQFSYAPDYPLNQVDFDRGNVPYIRETVTRDLSTGVFRKQGERWVLDEFESALKRVLPGFQRTVLGSTFFSTRTAFDRDGVYTTVAATETGRSEDAVRLLLYQPQAGAEFQAYRLDEPGPGLADLEGFTGHNDSGLPPPVLVYRLHQKAERGGKGLDRATLEMVLPEHQEDGTLSLEKRKQISDHAITLCTHSGGASTVVSHGDWVYLVYGEVTAEPKSVTGVPTYIVAYNRRTDVMEGPVLLGYAPPVNDMHNSSGIVIDRQGLLHVVLGAHGKNPFQYVRSRQPYSITGGWTAPQAVLSTGMKANGVGPAERGAQTYVGLVCDQEDTLHLAFRRDLQNVEGHFPGYNDRYRALAIQRKPRNGVWEEPREVVIPSLPGYSVYYHKLTIDRLGNLFLYLSYRPLHSVYRSELPSTGNHEALLTSHDGGVNWQLVNEDSFKPLQ